MSSTLNLKLKLLIFFAVFLIFLLYSLYPLHQFFAAFIVAINTTELCQPLYGVYISCEGRFTHIALLNGVKGLSFHQLLYYCLLPLEFYYFFSSNDISILTSLNLLTTWPPLLWPRCTRLFSLAHPYIVQSLMHELASIFIHLSLTRWWTLMNSLLLCFLLLISLEGFEKDGIKTPLKF